MGRLKRISFACLILGILSAFSWDVVDTLDSSDLDEWEQILVCPEELAGCKKDTCIKMCIDKGEDPLDCPEYCNQSV